MDSQILKFRSWMGCQPFCLLYPYTAVKNLSFYVTISHLWHLPSLAQKTISKPSGINIALLNSPYTRFVWDNRNGFYRDHLNVVDLHATRTSFPCWESLWIFSSLFKDGADGNHQTLVVRAWTQTVRQRRLDKHGLPFQRLYRELSPVWLWDVLAPLSSVHSLWWLRRDEGSYPSWSHMLTGFLKLF